MNSSNRNIIIFIFFVSASILFPFCKKEIPQPELPYAYINIFIYPNSLDYIPDGGYAYFSANPPSRGIIVYRPFNDEFMVYERTCPYDPNACCANNDASSCSVLIVEDSGMTIIDTCCNSQYLITDGSPFAGPSPYMLKQYQSYYNGDVLHIFN